MTRSHTRAVAIVASAAVLLPACAGDRDPQSQLQEAASRTSDSDFAYEATVEADDEALAGLGESGAQVGGFLGSFRVAGRRTGDATELQIGVLGMQVLEVRNLGPEEVYVRLGVGDLAALAGAGPEELSATVVPQLEQAGVSPDVVAAVDAGLSGRWVGVEGEIDTEALTEALGATPTEDPEDQAEEAKQALGGDIEGFIEQYVEVIDVTEADGQKTFDVGVRLRDVVRSLSSLDTTGRVQDLEADLQDLPEQVPGTVTVVDGYITRIAVDVAEAVRAGGGEMAGSIDLRLDLSQHGEVEAVAAPDAPVTITSEQLTEAVGVLTSMMGGVGTGLGGGPGASPAPLAPATPTG